MLNEEMKVIVNPAAASWAVERRWPQVRDLLRDRGAKFQAELTEAPCHATELARQALAEGYRLIVAVGGDGTVNEVINGLVVEGKVDPEITLGILPLGVGTDFVRTLGIPRDYKDACRCLMTGRKCTIDLGQMTCIHEGREVNRYFINAAGLGFDAEVANLTNRLSKVKALGGTIPYVISLLITLIHYQNKDVEIYIDGRNLETRANLVMVCNGQYLAGGMHAAPHASLDDGAFDVILVGDFGKLEFIATVPKVYSGTHLTHPKVDEYRGVKEVRVEAQERMFIQAEGESMGEAPVTFRIIPQALKVLA